MHRLRLVASWPCEGRQDELAMLCSSLALTIEIGHIMLQIWYHRMKWGSCQMAHYAFNAYRWFWPLNVAWNTMHVQYMFHACSFWCLLCWKADTKRNNTDNRIQLGNTVFVNNTGLWLLYDGNLERIWLRNPLPWLRCCGPSRHMLLEEGNIRNCSVRVHE
jgi:hypothetical protein